MTQAGDVVTILLIPRHPDLSVGFILGCGAFAATLVLEAGRNAIVAFIVDSNYYFRGICG